MKKYLMLAVSAALFITWSGICSAQSDAPYTEGPVWQLTMVKTKSGMTDDYLKGLAKTFKGTLEEAKKQNLILDYKILIGDAANPQDFDILLMVESKDMASLDNSREKFDPIAKKIDGQPRSTAHDRSQANGNSRNHGRQTHARSHAEIIHVTQTRRAAVLVPARFFGSPLAPAFREARKSEQELPTRELFLY